MVESDIITVKSQWDLMMMTEMKKITAMFYRVSQVCFDKTDWDELKAMYFLSRLSQQMVFAYIDNMAVNKVPADRDIIAALPGRAAIDGKNDDAPLDTC
jgi:hypothetical protein